MRRKETRLVHNVPKFRDLQRTCSGKHVHLGWGKVGPQWATATETAYPWGLCKLMASLLEEHFLTLGCAAPPSDITGTTNAVQASRAFAGIQSRKRVPPLLSEFASVHSVVLPSRLANSFLRPGHKLASDWCPGTQVACTPALQKFPAGSRVLRAHVLPKGCDEDAKWEGDSGAKSFQAGSFVHGPLNGVRSVTEQYPESVKAMCSYVRGLFPGLVFGTVGLFRDLAALPHKDANNESFTDNALAALSDFERGSLWMEDPEGNVEQEFRGEANVALERTETLRRWIALASELEPVEKALKADLPEFRKDVLSTKRLALFRTLLNEVQHEDVTLVDDILKGFDLTGKLPLSNVFTRRFKPAEQSEAQLRSGAKRLRDGLVATVKASDDPVIDQGVLKATHKELERGFVEGPIALSDVPSNASLTHRFGVRQGESEDGPKIRPIDNYLSSQVNSAVSQNEQISVHTIDIVAGLLGCWLNEWFLSGRSEHAAPVCKAWDLRTAYKQLPLSDSSYELDSYFILFNVEKGESEVYKQRVLPFGSTASVTSFIRAAYAIWKLGAVALTLAWSEYFDDYLNVCGAAFAKHCDFVITMPVRARRDEYVHIYVDASFEPGGYCGLGGLIFNSSGAALSWFGYKLQQCHVNKLLKDGEREKETVIFELEALALAISLEVFRPLVGRKGVVAFTDNEGVFGSFVRGHSDNSVCASLIDFFARSEEDLEVICWLDRVPSLSNPADNPSRGQQISGVPRTEISAALLARALPLVFK
ncbi:unnamed protein product [Symbiodinium sp. CCMP2592]|nr:unnamed protein product [Symbiodinium sp. CCMP2592]